MSLNRGTRRELELALRAVRTARAHLRQALGGLDARSYEAAIDLGLALESRMLALMREAKRPPPTEKR